MSLKASIKKASNITHTQKQKKGGDSTIFWVIMGHDKPMQDGEISMQTSGTQEVQVFQLGYQDDEV